MLPSQLVTKALPTRPRSSGKIRAGIMLPTRKCREEYPEARTLYQKLLSEGEMSFQDIADVLKKKTGKHLLTPSNTPYFFVRRGDFAVPEAADMLLDKYGEDNEIDGVAVRVIPRLPIVPYSDDIGRTLDFDYEAYAGGSRILWSDLRDGERVCMQYKPIAIVGGKAQRMPAGRDLVVRGSCDPISCPNYQGVQGTDLCKMKGSIFFFVPGISLATPFEMETSSKYFAPEAELLLREVRDATGGNLTRFDRIVFSLSKESRNVSMLDADSGLAKRVDQFIPTLSSSIDLAMLRVSLPPPPAQAERALAPVIQLLTGQVAPADVANIPLTSDVTRIDAALTPALSAQKPALADEGTAQPGIGNLENELDGLNGKELQGRFAAASREMGLDRAEVTAFGTHLLGEGWAKNRDSLVRFLVHLSGLAPKRKALAAALTAKETTVKAFGADHKLPVFWDLLPEECDKALSLI